MSSAGQNQLCPRRKPVYQSGCHSKMVLFDCCYFQRQKQKKNKRQAGRLAPFVSPSHHRPVLSPLRSGRRCHADLHQRKVAPAVQPHGPARTHRHPHLQELRWHLVWRSDSSYDHGDVKHKIRITRGGGGGDSSGESSSDGISKSMKRTTTEGAVKVG